MFRIYRHLFKVDHCYWKKSLGKWFLLLIRDLTLLICKLFLVLPPGVLLILICKEFKEPSILGDSLLAG